MYIYICVCVSDFGLMRYPIFLKEKKRGGITYNSSLLRSDLRLFFNRLFSLWSSVISCADRQSSGAQHRACSKNLDHGCHFSLVSQEISSAESSILSKICSLFNQQPAVENSVRLGGRRRKNMKSFQEREKIARYIHFKSG